MMKILALTKYSYEGPSSRYRFYNYKKCFEKDGIKLMISPLFDSKYFKEKSKYKKIQIVIFSYIKRIKQILKLLTKNSYDLVLIEYELLPYFPAFFEKILNKRGIKYIVDYDDAIFHKYDLHKNSLIRYLLKNKIPTVMKNATHIIACNQYLEDFAKRYNKNITRLPTVVLLDKYKEKMKNHKKRDDKYIIGWIGSKTTSVYVLDIMDILIKFLDHHEDVELHLVGFDKPLLEKKGIKNKKIKVFQWKEEEEIDRILDFDVGIMPLRDTPWSKGKCGFKLIQYMSCKKPVIASPVGINSSIVENGKNGYLVKHKNDWYGLLENIFYLSKNNIGNKGFEKILDEFNYDKNCEKYINLVKNQVIDV